MLRRSAGRVGIVGPMAAALAVTSLILARLFVSGDPLDRMWAEDGKIFLAHGGRVASLAETYAGYAHTLPRLLALLGHQLPVAEWAAFAVLASSVVVGALAGFVFAAARAVTGSLAAACVAASALALTPSLMFETLGSLANLQWFLLPAALWAVLLPPRRLSGVAAVVTATAAASTPLAVLLVPAAVLVHRREVLHRPAILGLAAGLLLQVLLIVLGPSAAGGPKRRPGLPADAGSQFLTHFGGTDVGPRAVAWAALAVVVTVLVSGVARGGPLRLRLVATFTSAVLLLVVTAGTSGDLASRYVAAASMMLFAGVALAVAQSRWNLVGVAILLIVAVVAFPAHRIRFSGPSWSGGVAAWARACAAGAPSGVIPVGPAGWGAARVACPRIAPAG